MPDSPGLQLDYPAAFAVTIAFIFVLALGA